MKRDETPADGHSIAQILKSTLLIGGSSVVNVAFSIFRNKAVAVMLGPEGIGLMGLYNSVIDIAQTLAGLGVQSSGVRQIAEATGTGEPDRIARTARIVGRLSIVLAVLGTLLLAALAVPVATLTFGDHQHAVGVILLSVAVFFRLAAGGQQALIQGMRDISSLARINVLSALFSTVLTIPLVYFFGTGGIVPSIVAVAAAMLLVSWWYGRKIGLTDPANATGLYGPEAVALLRLGFVFMVSGVLTFGSAYAIRIIIMHANGVVAAGLYQAAWALGGLYAGFILQAMGTDFYPRLTAISRDNTACNQLVNEQAQISMLLAGPGVLATLTFAPLAMWLFYSPEFHPAVNLLRWISLGMMLRIISWPMGFIVLAKGANWTFFWTDIAATVVHVGLAWLLVDRFGAIGAGAAFFGLYVWHSILIYILVRRLSGFRWSLANRNLCLIFLTLSALIFCATQFLPLWLATVLGSLAVLGTGLYSLKMLAGLVPLASLPAPIRTWISRFA
ncbi:O-antigen translocase [Rhizobium sp. KVB221]|uniref:O-antigen translocase n=1 Tax=Rhizobium setariae TaxID=2801340 RepID=A0A936YS68_9HYPH|nr:O-antigen translocase [Rhizobium setariae]MBL0373817.1 O-antigen translocase [Rhizobium setariae]